ncbi:MAG: hypothetical protein G3M78_00415 [Candidatus Nitrohelix vancouverensis]|uniref:Chromosome partition protein Smc n=1 Tax=Candidatus Nitrohelix vancouverensis TaxID=2705534 RepID=A0A7T0BZX4_9BACT|nr:MAG: hypothetical protein G3M78_00415 [Candidatus Nitrohelix vancouverensis]
MTPIRILQSASLAILIFFSSATAHAGLFDNDEENWKNIFLEIKKINARLQSLDQDRMNSVESMQRDTQGKMEALINAIQNINAELEGNRSATQKNQVELGQALSRLGDLELGVKNSSANLQSILRGEMERQDGHNQKFRVELAATFDRLKQELANQIDVLQQNSKQNFDNFNQSNQDSLKQVVASLNSQNSKLESSQSNLEKLIKVDLIPAVSAESRKSRDALVSDLEKLRTSLQVALDSHQSGLNANREQMKANVKTLTETITTLNLSNGQLNKEMIEILKQDLLVNAETQKQTRAMAGGLERTEQNLALSKEMIAKLKDVVVARLDAQAQKQDGVVAQVDKSAKDIALVDSNLRVADEKLASIAKAINALHGQGQASQTSLDAMRVGVNNLENAGIVANKKMDQLIDSSKAVVSHAASLEERVVASRSEIDNSNQKLSKLIDILKAMAQEQSALKSLIQSSGGSGVSQDDVKKILEALADLRRKANVNISRNDDIKSTVESLSGSGKR